MYTEETLSELKDHSELNTTKKAYPSGEVVCGVLSKSLRLVLLLNVRTQSSCNQNASPSASTIFYHGMLNSNRREVLPKVIRLIIQFIIRPSSTIHYDIQPRVDQTVIFSSSAASLSTHLHLLLFQRARPV